jgi:membrane-associated phospholipid phosphatase
MIVKTKKDVMGYILLHSLNMKRCLCLFLLFIPALAFCQKTDTLLHKLDSLDKKADTVGQTNIIKPAAYNDTTRITLKNYFVLLGSDFKQQALAPLHINKKSWSKVIKFGLITGALMFTDEPVQKRVVIWRQDNKGLTTASKYLSNSGGIYEGGVLAALSTYGFLFKNEKIRTTSLLATQAYITSEVFNQVLKTLASRQRPSVYDKNQVESEPRFLGPFAKTGFDASGKKLNASFPSGHATLAFAAATVYAMEYKNRPLIPILSYTGATLISLSRVVENAHWMTDIFVGATLGYLSGKQVVNNYHRYAKIKDGQKKKDKLSFNLQYSRFGMMPGLVYTPAK